MLVGFGVDLTIHALSSELAGRGHDVTVYAPVADEQFGDRPYHIELIPTVPRQSFPLYERNAAEWASFIDASDHDVVCITAFPFFSLLPKLRTPAVAVDYGDVPTGGLPVKRRLNFAYMKLRQQRGSFPKARAVVTISEFVRSLLPGPLRDRARTIYLGVDHYPRAEAGQREEVRKRLGIDADAPVALYVGRLNPEGQPYKGTSDLLALASRWRAESGVRLVMAGLGSEDDASRIRASGAVPVLAPSVSEMPGLYACADVYVTASRWEGFDLPVMEAAYQGVPAVALRVGAHAELVDEDAGILAGDIAALGDGCVSLIEDVSRRRAMGEAAARRAASFTWAETASRYEELFDDLGAKRKRAPAAAGDVTAVILNFEAPRDVLEPCVRSVVNQSHPVRTLVVDNGSARNREVLEAVEREYPSIEVLRLDANHGFSGGMNRGVAHADTDLVLLLNNDVVLAPDAVEEMVRVAGADANVAGVAPKLLNQDEPHFFDAVGTAIDALGRAHNVGIGQIDVGQYDRVEPRLGVCFAAALLRRGVFREGMVGPLDERYFMYYEDVDWCLRASLLGYTFLTAPRAVVYHAHSYTAKQMHATRKQKLIMRNLLRTVIRDYPPRRWQKVVAWWTYSLVRSTISGPSRRVNLSILLGLVSSLPRYVPKRRAVQGRRRRSLDELLRLAEGEEPFFDPAAYRPVRSLEALTAMYRRLYVLSGDPQHLTIAQAAALITESGLAWDREIVCSRMLPLVSSEPPVVKDYIQNLDGFTGAR